MKLFTWPKKNSGRWSDSPIDISFLSKFDGKFALETPQLKFNKLKLKSFKLRANLQNGSLKIREATGNLLEGNLKLDGKVTTSNKNSKYQTQFTLNRMNLPLALRALEDRTLKSGTLDLTGNYHTKGRSVADLVSHLNGSGSFSFNGIDISSRTKRGSAFSSISILLSSLNKFAGVIGGKGGSEKAKLHGLFQVVNGIAKFKNTDLTSSIGSGTAKGVVDFVGSCVCQIFTFQVNLSPAAHAGQVLREVQSGGTPGVAMEQMAQTLLEFRIGLGRLVRIVQFGTRSHQRFGDEFPTKVAESTSVIGEEEVPLIYICHEVFLLIS